MVSYSLFDGVLDVISLASTVAVVVSLISGLQPLFKRARESCRAFQPPEGRALLLWSALFVVPTVWAAAAALYFRILYSLWDSMGALLEEQPVNRLVYTLLHLYLFFLLVFGIYAFAITALEIIRNGELLTDLVMIARFDPRRSKGHRTLEDMEAQQDCSLLDPAETDPPLPQDEDSHSNGQGSNDDIIAVAGHLDEPEYPTEEGRLARS